jgi:hypothetical protein
MNDHTTHPLLREWTLGKALQRSEDEHRDEFLQYRNLNRQETSLSQKVCRLVLFNPQEVSCPADSYLDENKLLRWELMTKEIITDGADTVDEDILFALAAKSVHKISQSIHEQIFLENGGRMLRTYLDDENLLSIVTNRNRRIFDMFFDAIDEKEALFAFQCIVPFLERGLQDVLYNYWLYAQQNDTTATSAQVDEKTLQMIRERVPTKLNELFLLPELGLILGNDVVFLLRAFIGPLNGLNLRNVTIHGFITPQEFQPAYTTFLLVLMFSVSQLLNRYFAGKTYYYRDWFDCRIDLGEPIIDRTVLSTDSPIIKNELIHRSMFVLPQWRSYWEKAIDFYVQEKYFHFLVCIFPLIEHSIRRIYVCANQVEDRLLTAEKDALYTTLDILLDTRQGTQNKIFEEIGPALCNYLFDLFVWTDSGLRIRDHVSHGNVDPFEIPHIIADRVLVVALALCSKYYVATDPMPKSIVLEQVISAIEERYEPLYHPKSVLDRKIKSISQDFTGFGTFLHEREMLTVKEGTDDLVVLLIQRIEECTAIMKECSSRLQVDVSARSIFIVHDTEKELRKVMILNKIVSHIKLLIDGLESSIKELEQKVSERKAWKRDRKALELLQDITRCFYHFFALLLTISKFELHIGESEEKSVLFVLSLWNVSGSLVSLVEDGKWARAFESMLGLIIEQTEFGNKLPYKTLSQRQVKQLYVDVKGYYANNYAS